MWVTRLRNEWRQAKANSPAGLNSPARPSLPVFDDGLIRSGHANERVIYLFSHTLTEAFKAYAGQKKSKSRPRGLSHLSRPPPIS
jgi:hypothetical protein